MTPADLEQRFRFAVALAERAGEVALGYFRDLGSLTVTAKGPQDLVSEADLNTELLIRSAIAKQFPDDAFFGEETGPTGIEQADGIWVVDPIDGTQPFVTGLPDWAVSIGFLTGRTVRFGVVNAPVLGEIYAGCGTRGATLNGRPITVNRAEHLSDGVIAVGYAVKDTPEPTITALTNLLRAGGKFFRNGSAALSLCLVAAGRLNAFVEHHVNSWDCAGAIGVLQAAGAKVNDVMAGDGLARGGRVFASSPELYPAIAALFDE